MIPLIAAFAAGFLLGASFVRILALGKIEDALVARDGMRLALIRAQDDLELARQLIAAIPRPRPVRRRRARSRAVRRPACRNR